MLDNIKCVIFDLDGVVVDTAKYHYLAWKRLAEGFHISFTEKENENFKGVSRMACMDIICDMGGLKINDDLKVNLANMKNEWYVEYINSLEQSEMFDNVKEFILELKKKNIKIALGSASKNARFILEKLEIKDLFDTISDGTRVKNAKPDPEVFLLAASDLNIKPQECLVIEDAKAGVEAAYNGKMKAIGIGDKDHLSQAEIVYSKASDMIALLDLIQ